MQGNIGSFLYIIVKMNSSSWTKDSSGANEAVSVNSSNMKSLNGALFNNAICLLIALLYANLSSKSKVQTTFPIFRVNVPTSLPLYRMLNQYDLHLKDASGALILGATVKSRAVTAPCILQKVFYSSLASRLKRPSVLAVWWHQVILPSPLTISHNDLGR